MVPGDHVCSRIEAGKCYLLGLYQSQSALRRLAAIAVSLTLALLLFPQSPAVAEGGHAAKTAGIIVNGQYCAMEIFHDNSPFFVAYAETRPSLSPIIPCVETRTKVR